jgi:hypothetical protein
VCLLAMCLAMWLAAAYPLTVRPAAAASLEAKEAAPRQAMGVEQNSNGEDGGGAWGSKWPKSPMWKRSQQAEKEKT